MRADLLCSGSKGNACLVRSEGHCLLIDCGSTKRYLSQAFASVDASFQDVEALLVTHGHTDHISQLKQFAGVPAYSCCDLKQEQTKVMPGDVFRTGPFTVHVVGLSHDAPGTVGYVIEDGKSKLVYITDTGYVQQKAIPLLSDADAYIFESNHDIAMLLGSARPMFVKQRILSDRGHLCNEESARNLACLVGCRTKHVILAHISEEGNTRQLALDAFYEGFARRGVACDHLDVRAAAQFEVETILDF